MQWASRQQAMVSTKQLRAAGLDRAAVRRRIRRGWLHPVHYGVVAVGSMALPPLAYEWAAILACGPHAVLSHRSAAAMWGLLPKDPDVVDVTVPTHRRHREGIRVHRAPLARSEVRIREDLPVTQPLRTIADLAKNHELSAADLARAIGEALFRRLVNESQLDAIPRARGLLKTGAAGSRHDAERILGRLIVRAGLPRPRRNERIHGYEADFYWPDAALDLELDGFDGHGNRLAFERDRRRDLHLRARGVEVIRVTWWQLRDEREALVATLARATAGPRALRARA